MTTNRPLDPEREALGSILSRLMAEETNLETLCKHAPRIVSVAANVARIQAGLTSARAVSAEEINAALRELTSEGYEPTGSM